MKKQRIFRLVSVILALILLASCTSQKGEGSDNGFSSVDYTSLDFILNRDDYLSQEKESEISAYVRKDNYEYQAGQYFGTYNGYDVVLISEIDGVEYRDEQIMKIDEYGFFIGDTEKLVAYKDDSYLLLSEAYNKGVIEKGDVENVCCIYSEHKYSFHGKISRNRVWVVMKNDINNPDRKYTADDFPTIKVEKIIHDQWLSNESGQGLEIVLPIKNRRNVLNAVKELKKTEGVLSAQPIESIPLE